MDPIQLSTGFKDQGFASPQSFEVCVSEKIIFKALDADFEVIFPKANLLFDGVSETVKSYKVTKGDLKETDKLLNANLPSECNYMVRRTDIDETTGKAPAKMTVKAVITRNG